MTTQTTTSATEEAKAAIELVEQRTPKQIAMALEAHRTELEISDRNTPWGTVEPRYDAVEYHQGSDIVDTARAWREAAGALYVAGKISFARYDAIVRSVTGWMSRSMHARGPEAWRWISDRLHA